MPLTVPPFTQFQGTLFPLRGLWNCTPKEGDRFVNAEIDWGSTNTAAVQFSLSGNSPVALSQIVALYVDNRRCGVDADFQFPDSGFLLTVPARAQGLFPVLTNALMFYAIGVGAGASDVTIVQILNSMPPPIPLVPSLAQNTAGVVGVSIATNSTTPIVAPPASGTLNTISLAIEATSTGGGGFNVALVDGAGPTLWASSIGVAAGQLINLPINLAGLSLRFRNGLSLVISGSSGVTGSVAANIYYSTP